MLFNRQVLNDIDNTQTTRGSIEIISLHLGGSFLLATFPFFILQKLNEKISLHTS